MKQTYLKILILSVCLIAKISVHSQEAVDLGLSVKWADRNIGASSPSAYGNYYAWGETVTKSTYNAKNCKTFDSKITNIGGNIQYDIARKNWKGTWRLPTQDEFQELKDKCQWQWTNQDGHRGYKIIGPNGKSIFLPAAGHYANNSNTISADGLYGYYWTQNGTKYGNAGSLCFTEEFPIIGESKRYDGMSVRPVSE